MSSMHSSRPHRKTRRSRSAAPRTAKRHARRAGRHGRTRTTSRRSQAARARAASLPRDARGRFLPAGAFVEVVPPGPRVARQASRMPKEPERRVVKRRWWRREGPQDPGLPKGYAYEDQVH